MEDGRLRYELKRPWQDGTEAIAFAPRELVERLFSLIPQLHLNTIRYHGGIAPWHRFRRRVVADREAEKWVGSKMGGLKFVVTARR